MAPNRNHYEIALAALKVIEDTLRVAPIPDGGATDRNVQTLRDRLQMALNAAPPAPVLEDEPPPRRKRKSKATSDPDVAEVRGTVETEDGVEY
tara:strand:- start:417 stop:695 length:279 start_codon:yes stop_codon:yes gene_type:complete